MEDDDEDDVISVDPGVVGEIVAAADHLGYKVDAANAAAILNNSIEASFGHLADTTGVTQVLLTGDSAAAQALAAANVFVEVNVEVDSIHVSGLRTGGTRVPENSSNRGYESPPERHKKPEPPAAGHDLDPCLIAYKDDAKTLAAGMRVDSYEKTVRKNLAARVMALMVDGINPDSIEVWTNLKRPKVRVDL